MKGITKRFPGILANDHIDFELLPGEVHALLGENGAGKSTLMSILSGLYHPDEGTISIGGRPVRLTSPKDSIENHIGMVYQHFTLVESHTVAENMILGSPTLPFFLSRPRIDKVISELSERLQMRVDPGACIWQLSVGEQQRVEILKALYRGAKILILDEPTAVLTPGEARELFATLKKFIESGCSVVFISHKLEEVMAISQRVTVLKAGKVVGTVKTSETTAEELARMMVGREITLSRNESPSCGGEIALEVKGLCADGERGVPALRGLDLNVRKGEILGIAGVAGNGQKELSLALNGLCKIRKGTISVCGVNITKMGPREVRRQGVAFIPEDRLRMGLVPPLPVEDNMALRDYWSSPFSRGPFLDARYIGEFTSKMISDYGISIPRRDAPVRALSGGNLQKILLSRELAGSPRVIVAVYPTRGLDIGAVDFVHTRLLEEKRKGAAILLISEDLEEILDIADNIAVIYEGRIVSAPAPCAEAKIEEIGLQMSGMKKDEGAQCR